MISPREQEASIINTVSHLPPLLYGGRYLILVLLFIFHQ